MGGKGDRNGGNDGKDVGESESGPRERERRREGKGRETMRDSLFTVSNFLR